MTLKNGNLTIEICKEYYSKWSNALEYCGEQHDIPNIFIDDLRMKAALEDLESNWNEYHAELFVRMFTEILFPKYGIF